MELDRSSRYLQCGPWLARARRRGQETARLPLPTLSFANGFSRSSLIEVNGTSSITDSQAFVDANVRQRHMLRMSSS